MTAQADLESRKRALMQSLAETADALAQRRARDISDATIDKFVALRWLEWSGGTLRLTEAGQTVLMKAQVALLQAA